jgi:alanine racemase
VRSWLQIDLGAIAANARALSQIAAPATLCAVLKSNAYGHGLVPVGRALSDAGLPGMRLAVFDADEALALREAGIREPVLVVGPVGDGEVADAARASLECAVLAEDDVARFSAHRFAAHQMKVHVKIDTGTSRFGVRPSDATRVIDDCTDAGLRVVGIYSHLANAEDLDKAFTLEQLRRLQSIRSFGGVRHIAASAAAILWPETRLDMVRCGIALYGFWPSEQVREAARETIVLKPALRWFAPIAQVRNVAAGETVGYGCEFTAARESIIGVLPLGYADGLPRGAGGRLSVKIDSSFAPIVGRICMNACMVDLSDLQPSQRPARGDAVEIDVEDAASAAGTINYEILARLPASVERRYG